MKAKSPQGTPRTEVAARVLESHGMDGEADILRERTIGCQCGDCSPPLVWCETCKSLVPDPQFHRELGHSLTVGWP